MQTLSSGKKMRKRRSRFLTLRTFRRQEEDQRRVRLTQLLSRPTHQAKSVSCVSLSGGGIGFKFQQPGHRLLARLTTHAE